MVDVATNQHQLILAIACPVGVVDGEALASEVKHVASLAFVEPENPLRPEHLLGHLVVQEVLEFAQGEGTIALEGQGREPFDGQMIRVFPMAVVMVIIVFMLIHMFVLRFVMMKILYDHGQGAGLGMVMVV